MYRTQCVSALLACTGLAHSFSWDIVGARDKLLEFYNGETLTYSVETIGYIDWITYDPLHNRVLFAYKTSISDPVFSFDIASGKTQSLIKRKPDQHIRSVAYDPATELLFMIIDKIMYSFSLKPGSNNEANGNLVINLEKQKSPREIVVDSCGGYVYWTTSSENYVTERVRFDGSEREVVIDSGSDMKRRSLTIDPETQKIYWIERKNLNIGFSIESADLNGKNRKTLYRESPADVASSYLPGTLTVSKDYFYWGGRYDPFFWQLTKNPTCDTDLKPKRISMHNTTYWGGFNCIVTNFNIEEQTK